MKLTGLLEYSLGGFLTLRGYAKIGDLADISFPDKDFQRELIPEHRDNLIRFLNDKEFLYFPEIILGVSLLKSKDYENYADNLNEFLKKIQLSEGFKSLQFPFFKLSFSKNNILTIYLDDNKKIFSRIDGNHRLAAVEESMKQNPNTSLKDSLCPFSIVIFRDEIERNKYSKVLFNNINSKAIPVTLEHNTRLIIEDEGNYNDERLKNDPSFGWEYYFTRKIYNEMDFDYLSNLQEMLKDKKASALLQILKFLLDENVVKKENNEIKKIKKSLSKINNIYDDTNLKKSKSVGLLGAFIYFSLKKDSLLSSFKNWAIENHLTLINDIQCDSLTKIYHKILSSKKRTIFVSMPFRKETESHYETIKRIVKEINAEFNLRIKLKLHRVDWFENGTSYEITEKIFELIDNSGFLIADLSFANTNVYHEVGYLMGRNKAQSKRSYSNFLLILNEKYGSDSNNVDVAFNLRGLKQIRFSDNETLGKKLKENIKKFYRFKDEI